MKIIFVSLPTQSRQIFNTLDSPGDFPAEFTTDIKTITDTKNQNTAQKQWKRRSHAAVILPVCPTAKHLCVCMYGSVHTLTQTQRHTQTDKDTKSHTDNLTHTHIYKVINTPTDTQTDTLKHTDTERQSKTHKQIHTHPHRHTHTHPHTHTHTERERHSQIQTDTPRHTQTHTHRVTHTHQNGHFWRKKTPVRQKDGFSGYVCLHLCGYVCYWGLFCLNVSFCLSASLFVCLLLLLLMTRSITGGQIVNN